MPSVQLRSKRLNEAGQGWPWQPARRLPGEATKERATEERSPCKRRDGGGNDRMSWLLPGFTFFAHPFPELLQCGRLTACCFDAELGKSLFQITVFAQPPLTK